MRADVIFRASTSPPGVTVYLPTTPILTSNVTNGPLISPSTSTRVSPGRTVSGPPLQPLQPPTTAETLLKSFYTVGNDVPRSPRRQSVAPPSQFLFGSGPSNAPPSIWSTTHDQNPNLSPRTASVTNPSQALPSYGAEHTLPPPSNRGTHLSNQPPSLSPFAHLPSTWSPAFESAHDAPNMHMNHPASLPFGPGHHNRSMSHSASTMIQSSPSYQTGYNAVNHRPFAAYPQAQEPLYLSAEIAPSSGFAPEVGGLHFQQGAYSPYPAASSQPQQQQPYSRPMQLYPTSSVWGNVG